MYNVWWGLSDERNPLGWTFKTYEEALKCFDEESARNKTCWIEKVERVKQK